MHENSFPVLTHDVVTQGHVNYCKENGHATHKVADVTSPFCPRCGERLYPEEVTDTYYGRELGDVVMDIHRRQWVIVYTVKSDGTRAGTAYMGHLLNGAGEPSAQAFMIDAEQLFNN